MYMDLFLSRTGDILGVNYVVVHLYLRGIRKGH